MNDSILTLLGLIRRAGKLDFTDSGCRSALNENRSCLIIIAKDASSSVIQRFVNRSKAQEVPCIVSDYTKYDLSVSLGCASCCVVSVNDRGFAEKILSSSGNQ